MTINNKSERNYRGKCLGWPVTSYDGDLDGAVQLLINVKAADTFNSKTVAIDLPALAISFPNEFLLGSRCKGEKEQKRNLANIQPSWPHVWSLSDKLILRSDMKADFLIHPSSHISLIQSDSVWFSLNQSESVYWFYIITLNVISTKRYSGGALVEIEGHIRKRTLIGIITKHRFVFVCFMQFGRKFCLF